MLLVLMDNGTSEYAFVSQFFDPVLHPSANDRNSNTGGSFAIVDSDHFRRTPVKESLSKEKTITLEKIWKQVFDPVLEYCEVRLFKISTLTRL